jgi:glycosyltransferase involved in cell wall biosynthesis
MNPPSEPLVSIVTPVYNEEKHLAECIESILGQTYRNWDYTIVDNCSTDESAAIAERYASLDGRIRVLRCKEFVQAFANCNRAVRQISPASKYCKVVLGDDWLFPECLSRMVGVAEKHPSVGLVSAYALEGERVVLTGLPYQTSFVQGREACRRGLLEGQYVFGTQTSVLYRADIVRSRDPFYEESNVHSDTEVCYALLKNADFGFVHQVLTYTRVRPGSLNARSLELQTSWAAILNLLVNHGSDYLTPDELKHRLARHLSAYYCFLGKSLLMRRDRNFWDYHTKQLSQSGVGYSRARVIAGFMKTLAWVALNPGQASRYPTRKHREPDLRTTSR